MQIAYHQQYKDLDDRQIVDLVLSDENEIQTIKQRAKMDIPLSRNLIEIYPGLIECRNFTSFCHSQCDYGIPLLFVINTFFQISMVT